jgi:hypothetical protein
MQLENAAIFLEIIDFIDDHIYLLGTARKDFKLHRLSQFKDTEISKRHIDFIKIKITRKLRRIANGDSF